MAKLVKLPDGSLAQFPDTMSDDDIQAVLGNEAAEGNPSVQQQPDTSRLGTFADQGLQGATFGFGDEMKAYGGAALLKGLEAAGLFDSQGKSYGELVDIGLNKERENLNAQQDERPALSVVSQLAGGIGTGLAGAKTAAGKAITARAGAGGLGTRVVAGAATGAASGATYGAGTGEGVDGRLQGAGTGAVLGGITGAALPAVASGVRGGAKVAADTKVGRVVEKAATGTKNAIFGRDADAILASRLTNQDLPTIRAELKAGGKSASLADVAGDEVRGLMRAVGRTPGGAKDVVSDFLETRSDEAVTRVQSALSKHVSNVDAYFGNLEDLAKARAMIASPLYKQAHEEAVNIIDDRLPKYLNDKRVVEAMSEARKSYGVRLEAPTNSLENLDGVKKVLDDKIGEALRSGKTNLAGSYGELKNGLVQVLDDASPTYAKARGTFAGFKAMESAQETGQQFRKYQPEQLKKIVRKLSPSEREAFLIGVRNDLQVSAAKAGDSKTGDVAFRIFGSGREGNYKAQQLKAVLGNDANFRAFSNKMQQEIRATDTKNMVLGGSRTDFNLAEDASPMIDAAAQMASQGKGGVKSAVTDALFTGVQNRFIGLNRENSLKLAKIMTDKQSALSYLDRLIEVNKNAPSQQKILLEAKTELPVILGLGANIIEKPALTPAGK